MRSDRRPKKRTPTNAAAANASNTIALLGNRIRELRFNQELPLHAVAQRAGMSQSMLSLVERGKASPSISTLIAITSALGVHISDLFDHSDRRGEQVVSEWEDHPVFSTVEGTVRRIIHADRARGIEVFFSEYEPSLGRSRQRLRHSGFDYGFVIQGQLTVEVNGTIFKLKKGDSISYPSNQPHKIENKSSRPARAIWINLED